MHSRLVHSICLFLLLGKRIRRWKGLLLVIILNFLHSEGKGKHRGGGGEKGEKRASLLE